jgi:hypothetical protein
VSLGNRTYFAAAMNSLISPIATYHLIAKRPKGTFLPGRLRRAKHVGLDVMGTFSCWMRGRVRDSQGTDPSWQKIVPTNELVNPGNWGRNQSYHASSPYLSAGRTLRPSKHRHLTPQAAGRRVFGTGHLDQRKRYPTNTGTVKIFQRPERFRLH